MSHATPPAGSAKAHKNRVTMQDIARRCNVSTITVSRAMASPHLVREPTRLRILEAAREMEYTYNVIARTFRSGSKQFFGLIAPVPNDSQFLSIIRATQEALSREGLQTLLGLTALDTQTELGLIDQYTQLRSGGIVLYGVTCGLMDRYCERLAASSVPIVLAGDFVENERCHSIGYDLAESCREAVLHLTALGHRRIAFQCGPEERSCRAASRLRGYRRALEAAGLEFIPELVARTEAGLEPAEEDHLLLGYMLMERMLALKNRPTAMVFAADPFALGGMLAVQAAGLAVPRDFSLVSTREYAFGNRLPQRLTTTRVPGDEVAELTVDFLKKCARGELSAPYRRCLHSKLIVGDTSSVPRHMA